MSKHENWQEWSQGDWYYDPETQEVKTKTDVYVTNPDPVLAEVYTVGDSEREIEANGVLMAGSKELWQAAFDLIQHAKNSNGNISKDHFDFLVAAVAKCNGGSPVY